MMYWPGVRREHLHGVGSHSHINYNGQILTSAIPLIIGLDFRVAATQGSTLEVETLYECYGKCGKGRSARITLLGSASALNKGVKGPSSGSRSKATVYDVLALMGRVK